MYINVKRQLNSAAKTWTQFNYNITLNLAVKLFMVVFTEIIYSLRYNTLITKN